MRALVAAAAAAAAAAVTATASLPPPVVLRPNLYFGTRGGADLDVLSGVAWQAATGTGGDALRHSCRHHHGLQQWGWLEADGERFAVEHIGDRERRMNMSVQWLAETLPASSSTAAAAAGSWRATIEAVQAGSVRTRSGARRNMKAAAESVSLFFYLAVESPDVELSWQRDEAQAAATGEVVPLDEATIAADGAILAGGDAPAPTAAPAPNAAPVHGGRIVGRRRSSDGSLSEPLFALSVEPDKSAASRPSTPAFVWVPPRRKSGDDDGNAPDAAGTPAAAAAAQVEPERWAEALSAARYWGVRLPSDVLWDVDGKLSHRLQRNAAQANHERLARRSRKAREGDDDESRAKQAAALAAAPIIPLLPNTAHAASNLLLVQLVVTIPFRIRLRFTSGSGGDDGVERAAPFDDELASRRAAFHGLLARRLGLGGTDGTNGVGSAGSGGCAPDGGSGNVTADFAGCVARRAVSNLLGSTTLFSGSQLVQRVTAGETAPRIAPPHRLYTGVPSRSFFPRGFLWDEGFHQLVASRVAPALSWRVVRSWLATADATGWIAREQILGAEARSRVPEKFRVQRDDIANPPTLIAPVLRLAVDGLCHSADGAAGNERVAAFCRRHAASSTVSGKEASDAASHALLLHGRCGFECLSDADDRAASCGAADGDRAASCGAADGDRAASCGAADDDACASPSPPLPPPPLPPPSLPFDETMAALREVLPVLVRYGQWFLRTQAGRAPNSFRWRGATRGHNFASGLDDYPRGAIPSTLDENVDLLAWMAWYAHILADLLTVADESPATAAAVPALPMEAGAWLQRRNTYLDRLAAAHWDDAAASFCDLGVRAEDVPPPTSAGGPPAPPPPDLPVHRICHVGYVAILPFALRLLDPRSLRDRAAIGAALAAMTDGRALASPYGLRSLSASSPLFGSEEDYWRGSIWVNVNYLAVTAAQWYGEALAAEDGAAELAREAAAAAAVTRQRLLDNMASQYGATGFVWEHYDSRTGAGRGTHPFTGWSALVALLAGQRDVGVQW